MIEAAPKKERMKRTEAQKQAARDKEMNRRAGLTDSEPVTAKAPPVSSTKYRSCGDASIDAVALANYSGNLGATIVAPTSPGSGYTIIIPQDKAEAHKEAAIARHNQRLVPNASARSAKWNIVDKGFEQTRSQTPVDPKSFPKTMSGG